MDTDKALKLIEQIKELPDNKIQLLTQILGQPEKQKREYNKTKEGMQKISQGKVHTLNQITTYVLTAGQPVKITDVVEHLEQIGESRSYESVQALLKLLLEMGKGIQAKQEGKNILYFANDTREPEQTKPEPLQRQTTKEPKANTLAGKILATLKQVGTPLDCKEIGKELGEPANRVSISLYELRKKRGMVKAVGNYFPQRYELIEKETSEELAGNLEVYKQELQEHPDETTAFFARKLNVDRKTIQRWNKTLEENEIQDDNSLGKFVDPSEEE